MSDNLQKTKENDSTVLLGLPAELLNSILTFLVPQEGENDRYLVKTDLQALNLTCKKLNELATPMLFHVTSVTIRLNDVLPFEKCGWVKPGLLQAPESVTKHIESLRLRIEPFPSKVWSDEQFGRLVDSWVAVYDAGAFRTALMASEGRSTAVSERQNWVANAYSLLWQAKLARWYPLLQKTKPLVVALFELLTKVKHVEAGRWHHDILSRLPDSGMGRTMLLLSDAGAATALASTMPAQVKGYSFCCHPNNVSIGVQAYGLIGHLPIGIDYQAVFHPSATGWWMDWMRFTSGLVGRSSQLTTLDLTICNFQRARRDSIFPRALPPPGPAAAYWRSLLLPMNNLTVLKLTTGDRDLPTVEMSQHLPAIFPKGIILPSVKRLCLKSWVVPTTFLSEGLWKVFSNIEHLTLDTIATSDGVPDAWHTVLSRLPESEKRTGTVEMSMQNPEYAWSNSGHDPTGTPFEVYGTHAATHPPVPRHRTVEHPEAVRRIGG
ncbi:hypothetical protein LTR15_009543 [Elasticomyces elasticus]|nr:hypothetical protein LTR15_009543 [Elasticomyces elasticus]